MSFSFGSPSSAPANTGLSGFSFGANKPATPGFGLATSQPSTGLFGTPAATAAFGSTTPAFGATATPSFGATSTAPAFGATSTAPAFGATSTAPAFGATSTAPAFGATSTAPSFGAGTFGANTSFGGTNTAFGATSIAPTFGATSAAPTFGATSTAPAFGTGSTLGFGLGTSTAGGLSFGAPTATNASTGLGGFGLSTQPSLGLSTATTSTGLFGTGTKLGALGTQPQTSAAPSLGLGGITTASGIGTNNTNTGDGKGEPPKQTKLPNEISTTVDSFKEFVKKQKSLSSEIMRVSTKPLHKVSQDAEELIRSVMSLSAEVGKGRAQSKRLRSAGANALIAAETAGQYSPGSMLDGNAPPNFVKDLVSELEQQLIIFRRQMDVADKQMLASPRLLTEQELTLGIRRMHESLVALAGRLQAVHTQVEAQKEQYLNLRKYVLKDPTNVFEAQTHGSGLDQILRDADASRKKAKLSTMSDLSKSAVLSDPRTVLGNMQYLAGPTPFSYFGNSTSVPYSDNQATSNMTPQIQQTSFNTTSFSPFTTDNSFQLQKPPGKRGKQ